MLRPGAMSKNLTGNSTHRADGQWSSPLTAQQGSDEMPPQPSLPTKRIAKVLKKTSFCKHYLQGHCRFESTCFYAHEAHELMPKPDLAKTKLCAHFLAGWCRNENCSYAHGQEDVQKTRSMALSRAQAAFNPSSKNERLSEDGKPPMALQPTGWPPRTSAPSELALHQAQLSNANLARLHQPSEEPMKVVLQQQLAKQHGQRTPIRNGPNVQNHQPQPGRQSGKPGKQGKPVKSGSQTAAMDHLEIAAHDAAAVQAQAWQFGYKAELQHRVPNSNLFPGINYHCGFSGGQTPSTTSSDGPQQFALLDDVISGHNGSGINYLFKDENWCRNGNDLSHHIDEAQMDQLVSRKHERLLRWQSLVTNMMKHNHDWKLWLYKWLRSCERAEQLPHTIEYKIAQLFLRDSSWSAVFPRLSRQCMNRLFQHLQTSFEPPDDGVVYSL